MHAYTPHALNQYSKAGVHNNYDAGACVASRVSKLLDLIRSVPVLIER